MLHSQSNSSEASTTESPCSLPELWESRIVKRSGIRLAIIAAVLVIGVAAVVTMPPTKGTGPTLILLPGEAKVSRNYLEKDGHTLTPAGAEIFRMAQTQQSMIDWIISQTNHRRGD